MVGALILSSLAMAFDCHYQTWSWSVREKRPVDVRQIKTFKSKLTIQEKGSIEGCTVCQEDQAIIRVDKLPPFQICRRFASSVEPRLRNIQKSGFPIKEIEGYRVGKTKGSIDSKGHRTEFSNHSYGTAIDINSSLNGLYENCFVFNSSCRLLRGGEWRPERPGTITPASIVVNEMSEAQLKWGGELQGQQKDFMHFSPNGD
jgi:hypothetical protein